MFFILTFIFTSCNQNNLYLSNLNYKNKNNYANNLIKCKLLKRKDRFIIDVLLDNGQIKECHCNNSGRMESFVIKNADIWIIKNKGARTYGVWEMIKKNNIFYITNTLRSNQFIEKLIRNRLIPGLDNWLKIGKENPYPNIKGSRSDFCLDEKGGEKHWIEVKNTNLTYEDNYAYFPDSVSSRSTKQCKLLYNLKKKEPKIQATFIFTVFRSVETKGVKLSDFHDPSFAMIARKAKKIGINFRAFLFDCNPEKGIHFKKEIPVILSSLSLIEKNNIQKQWEKNQKNTGWIRSFDSKNGKHVANQKFSHQK